MRYLGSHADNSGWQAKRDEAQELSRQGKFEQADHEYRTALRLAEAALGPFHEDVLELLELLDHLQYCDIGDWSRSIPIKTRLLERHEAEVASSIERHVGNKRPVALSRAATEVLAIVAYRQPVARAGIELIRGSASGSALDTLLQRRLVADNQHHLLVTTRGFLEYAGLRDLADLPPLAELDEHQHDLGVLSHRP